MKIIGGNAKGTLLSAPQGRNTRPTLGRVRESVFNVLANVGILETKVLDIFAGTGAMGLEALSRGAAEAVFIDKATASIIRENAARCHVADRAKILRGDVSSSLKALEGSQFDYIFMDPPYRRGYINEILKMVLDLGLPAEDAVIIAEHSIFEPPDLSLFKGRLALWKEKKVGAIVVSYLQCRQESNFNEFNETGNMPGQF